MRLVWDAPILDIITVVLTLLTLIVTIYSAHLFRRRVPTPDVLERRHQELRAAVAAKNAAAAPQQG